MAVAALAVSIVSLLLAAWVAFRQDRLQRLVAEREQRDRTEHLALERYTLEHDERGWRRWGPGPPAPPGESD